MIQSGGDLGCPGARRLVRLSVGIEDWSDLLADFEQSGQR